MDGAVVARSLAFAALLAVPTPASAQNVKPRGNYPFVEIRDAQHRIVQGPVENNVVPLWPVRSCFGWVVTLPERDRSVDYVEIQRQPAPTRFTGGGFVANEASDTTTRKARAAIGKDGLLSHSWCVNDADPEGEVRFEIHVEGRFVAEFKFCAVKLPASEPVRLDALTCPRKFLGT